MTASRPIGERIRSVCQVLEKTGPLGMAGLKKQFPQTEPSTVFKCCNRAVLLGVLTADDSGPRRIYTVSPDWATIIATTNPSKVPPPRPRPQKYKGPILTRWVGAMIHMNEVRV